MYTSRWSKEARQTSFPTLAENITADVAVIGGGITGITTAYLLSQKGLRVALIDKARFGSGETSHTTAHLTYVTDTRLLELARVFGKERARLVWDAGRTAINEIARIVSAESIDCNWQIAAGYLHVPWLKRSEFANHRLDEEAALAQELGFAAQYVQAAPVVGRPAMMVPDQALFHPMQYLATLIERVVARGGLLFENTEYSDIEENPQAVVAGDYRIRCKYVVIATHVPVAGKTGRLRALSFQSKLAPYSSYAVGAELPPDPAARAMFWDLNNPYNYLRVEARGENDYAIFGGKDHKTGQEAHPEHCYEELETLLAEILPQARVTDRWSGQVIETHDGLPYIGETSEGQFIATGFSGNGMTFGTLAARMACDAIADVENPWLEAFHPTRPAMLRAPWTYLKENFDYPRYLVKDYLAPKERDEIKTPTAGSGKVMHINGNRLAVYCNDAGEISACSAVCPHLGCLVRWNSAEQTWDCPCHGSRFGPEGKLMAGPAEKTLEPCTGEALDHLKEKQREASVLIRAE
jgi:glycine/D-amino acid oxidase-like deaminating enzyme/nitrite reductase/ring-hydroxylating ferredoxin subunit